MPSARWKRKFFDKLNYICEHGEDDPQSKIYMLLLMGKYNLKEFGMMPLKTLKDKALLGDKNEWDKDEYKQDK